MDLAVIIAGCRDYHDYDYVKKRVDIIKQAIEERGDKIVVVLSGMQKGADTLGILWARSHDIPVDEYPADWKKYDRAAGPIRNEEMAKNANILIAFWNNKSRGTANMIRLADKYNLEIFINTIK